VHKESPNISIKDRLFSKSITKWETLDSLIYEIRIITRILIIQVLISISTCTFIYEMVVITTTQYLHKWANCHPIISMDAALFKDRDNIMMRWQFSMQSFKQFNIVIALHSFRAVTRLAPILETYLIHYVLLVYFRTSSVRSMLLS
jgi:hypothetical protein